MRTLILSHGHPSFSIGGAEVASYNLHQGLNQLPDSESHYLARVGPPIASHQATPFMSLRQGEREMLFYANDYNHFRLSNRNIKSVEKDLTRYVREVNPDIVHFHHLLGFGAESLYAVRKALPNVPIVLTLHEYLSICNNHGQMVKTKDGTLCQRSSPADCNICFANISPAEFMKRELYLKGLYRHVDMFVSPSQFLIDRYVEWGLPAEKLVMLENGLAESKIAPPRQVGKDKGRHARFGFFGQLNQFKGIKLLIEAVARVPEREWGADAALYVYGGNLEVQPEAFQKDFRKMVAAAGRRVRFFGSYKSADLPRLMQEIDWLVLPSTWYENSPVVIQEAFLHGRPVICSDIGGMAEKVRNNVTGLHFRVGSAESLVDRLTDAMQSPNLWERLHRQIKPPVSALDAARQHQKMYEALIKNRQRATAASPKITLTPPRLLAAAE
jgi:glycosyltransferase involved in cell wall biosynthesis